ETLIANLVGVACQGIVLSSFSDNLDRFSEQDWRLLAQRVPEFLEPNPLIEIVDGEANGALAALDMIINSKERAKEMGQILSDTSNDAFMTKLAEATPAQLQTLRRGLVRNLEEWGKAAKARLQQSEAHWSMPALPAPVTDEEKLFEIIMPSWDQVLATNARMRTQLRLLRLHALIQIYRWHWNALPDKLEQATTEIADPFTGESFVYERQDSGYKLFSRGNALTGEIQLRYRRAVTAGPQDEPPTGL
ncbi:MAG TPA: hypothetical protein VK934_10045, partial [Fimbriimonas sp.]|nr:hypothetical protein [Fimbriimonas sp.]